MGTSRPKGDPHPIRNENGHGSGCRYKQRPYWKDKAIWTKSDIARVRYSKADGEWTLHWRDRNEKWHAYDPQSPNAGLRGSPAGNQGRPDGDLLGVKGVGELGG